MKFIEGFQSTPSGGKATRPVRRWWWQWPGFNPRLPGGRRPDRAVCRYPNSSFNPRLPGGRRPVMIVNGVPHLLFQSTPSGGKATWAARGIRTRASCFNPRLPGGRRLEEVISTALNNLFQSTPSGGKATRTAGVRLSIPEMFQSTPSGGKATVVFLECLLGRIVSIHAFRGEGDGDNFIFTLIGWHKFQSTPSGGKATTTGQPMQPSSRFQSTPSGGKATIRNKHLGFIPKCFNPRLPGGRRPSSFVSRLIK